MVRCPRCKRPVPAIRNAAGTVIALPHMSDGTPVRFGETCR